MRLILKATSHKLHRFIKLTNKFAQLRPNPNTGCFLFLRENVLHGFGVIYHLNQMEQYNSMKADILNGSLARIIDEQEQFQDNEREFFPHV